MTVPAERMKTMRDRRRAQGLRELRLVLPDARSPSVQQRVAIEVARLRSTGEDEALSWIETVSEFDALDGSEVQ
ncbi:MAG: antitoxin MazE-like protein [Aliidongia sp.]